jgi:hypothetical protein
VYLLRKESLYAVSKARPDPYASPLSVPARPIGRAIESTGKHKNERQCE